MEKYLLYSYLGLTVTAVAFYMYSAMLGFRYVGGLMEGEQFVAKNYRVVLMGLIIMALASIDLMAHAYVKDQTLWHPLLLVNGLSIVLNATCLHTMYHKFEEKISARLSMATVFLDANIRFVVLYFTM